MPRSRSLALFSLALMASAVWLGCPSPHTTKSGTKTPSVPASMAPTSSPPDASTPSSALTSELEAPDVASWGVRQRRDPTDLCEPVRENLDRAARAIVVANRGKESPIPMKAWDHVTPPKFMDRVDRRFALTSAEKALLKKNGFVVPARLEARGYAHELHEIYQSQLPIYVSADAILHSVFKSNDAILEDTEQTLAPKLEAALQKMHDGLPKAKVDYPPEVASDVDLYLTVARSLLAAEDVTSALGTDAQAAPLVENARKGAGGLMTVTLFGRPRVIDFSQFGPRGHYTKTEEQERYFRGSMWLSRLEMNLVSRASRSSQPGICLLYTSRCV